MRVRLAGLSVLAILASGCDKTYDNPFQTLQGSSGPPADADLVFVMSPDATTNVREIFAVAASGQKPPTRLTSCASRTPVCDIVEVAPSPVRQRVVVRRRTDANADRVVDATEPESIYVMDLLRGIEGQILPTVKGVNSLAWTTLTDGPLFFSAPGSNALDDLFEAQADGTGAQDLSTTSDAHERHPRLAASLLTFERTEPGHRSQVWGSIVGLGLAAISAGDTTVAESPVPGLDYLLGSDADPEPTLDATHVVFRRLTGPGDAGRGTWDILTVGVNGQDLQTVASGGAFRGAPTWGLKGIAFVEIPLGSTTASLVLIDPSGNRKVLISGAPLNLGSPRWLQ